MKEIVIEALIRLKEVHITFDGWNWGQATITGDILLRKEDRKEGNSRVQATFPLHPDHLALLRKDFEEHLGQCLEKGREAPDEH